jgi:hypothetical protein
MTPDEVACFYTMLYNYRLITNTSHIEVEDGAGPGAAWFGEFLRQKLNTSVVMQGFRRIFAPNNIDQDTVVAIATSSENADQFVEMVANSGQAGEEVSLVQTYLKPFAGELFPKTT